MHDTVRDSVAAKKIAYSLVNQSKKSSVKLVHDITDWNYTQNGCKLENKASGQGSV